MKKVAFDFCFKGERNYVQGPDIYNQLIKCLVEKYLHEPKCFKLSLHRLVRKNCLLVYGRENEELNEPENYCANLSFIDKDIFYKGYVIEDEKEIYCRYPYNEEAINKLLEMSSNKVCLLYKSPLSFIETIVAMNKKLHYEICSREGKWLFTKLELKKIPKENTGVGITIKLVKNFKNFMTKSKIYYREKELGYIYFSLVVKE